MERRDIPLFHYCLCSDARRLYLDAAVTALGTEITGCNRFCASGAQRCSIPGLLSSGRLGKMDGGAKCQHRIFTGVAAELPTQDEDESFWPERRSAGCG